MTRLLSLALTATLLSACGAPNTDTSSSSSTSTSSSSSSSTSSSSSSSSSSSTSSSSGQPAPQPRCDASVTAASREAVTAGLNGLFVQKQPSAIQEYWADPYLQHNPAANSGVQAFSSFMTGFVTSGSFNYSFIRTVAECDLVVVQGKYGNGVIFDILRVKDGKLVEHWDSASNQASSSAGPTEVVDVEATHRNRQAVEELYELLIAGDMSAANDYFSNAVTLRNDSSLSGSDAFTQYLAGDNISYSKVHRMIADGNFVFALVEGKTNGKGYGYYDLFRLEDGLIVEYWNSRIAVQNTASGLGIF